MLPCIGMQLGADKQRHELLTFDSDGNTTSWTCCPVAAFHVNHHFCDQSYINLLHFYFHHLNVDMFTMESGHTQLCNTVLFVAQAV